MHVVVKQRPVRIAQQLKLFADEKKIGNHGHCRTISGALCEEIVSTLIGGRRCHTVGELGAYCPDVVAGDYFLECKSMGTGTTFIYRGRLENDRRLVSCGQKLVYAVLRHGGSTSGASSVEEYQYRILSSLKWLSLIPFAAIDLICQSVKEELLNTKYGKRYGYSSRVAEVNRMYGSGYRIPEKLLLPFVVMEFES